MLDSEGAAIILGEVRGFLWRDFSSRVRRLVAIAEAILKEETLGNREVELVCRKRCWLLKIWGWKLIDR